MNNSDGILNKDTAPIEQHQSAAESAPTRAEDEENLDTDFNDPRLAAELKKSREMLENWFADQERHLDAATRIAKRIRSHVEEERK